MEDEIPPLLLAVGTAIINVANVIAKTYLIVNVALWVLRHQGVIQ